MTDSGTGLRISASTLGALGRTVAVPNYDRGRLQIGIVHIGVGGFHRAHQAMYLDRLMNLGEATDWAICGVGVLPGDRRMRDALGAQDFLYTLIQKEGSGVRDARVIGSIIDYIFAPDRPDSVIERLADPATRIVSLTITEGGYNVDDLTGSFNDGAPDIEDDLTSPNSPRTVFGLVTAGLRLRRERAIPPFTVVSCDNLPGNGDVARTAFTSFAGLLDPGLADWIAHEVRFPNSMIDRITPATTNDDRDQLRDQFGVEDCWPVVCEPFAEWVLEDTFSCGRPALEHAGVRLVDDVTPYEHMKLRLLNASHQGLGYFGRLCGYEFVHEAAQDPLIRNFLREYMDDEAVPTLSNVPPADLEEFKRPLLERLTNAAICDTLARICTDSSDRIPKFVLPVARRRLADAGQVRHCAAIVASWARYAEGVDEQGLPIEVVDRQRERIMTLAARQLDEPLAFLTDRGLFGDLIDREGFVRPYLSALNSLHENGARATLDAITGAGTGPPG